MTTATAQESLRRYETEKVEPGAFLYAILTNDLFGTLRAADPESLQNLQEITRFVWNKLPGNIWGTPEKIRNHLKNP